MPRSQDLEIFVMTTDGQTDRQTDYFTFAHACGVIMNQVESQRSKLATSYMDQGCSQLEVLTLWDILTYVAICICLYRNVLASRSGSHLGMHIHLVAILHTDFNFNVHGYL